MKIPLLDIINYIKKSLYIIIQIKLKEELEKYKENKDKKILEENTASDYETLLRKEEAEIRRHICVEHQFKLHCENLEQKLWELEEDNLMLEKKLDKQKKKYENQIKDINNELSFLKNQKNNQKLQEKNLKYKITLKEKEINELKTILNTNASLKSQISSIYQDPKEDENSKEINKEKEREILPYMDNNMNMNIKKKKQKNKSLSLIERKLSSFSSINRRNLLRVNYINKSHNSRNNSKRKNSSKKNKNKILNYNTNNNNNVINNYNSEYKYKTIANIYSGSSTKRTNNDNSLKLKNKVKQSSYYNYNSINSLRQKKLDKSVSRSMPSKRWKVEESFNKNYFLNINRSDISSNKNKKLLKDNNVIKNKILINYNTNIINTNISIDKSSINKKMKELKNSLDGKLSDITRNKKNSIRRTISAFYDKKDKSSIFQEKIRTKREHSFKNNNLYSIDKNNSLKIRKNKNNIVGGFNNINSEYNSNFFRKKLPQLTIQQKNKNIKKTKKVKIKLKDNSMFNIKNDNSKEMPKNKFLIIQAYTGKNPSDNIKINKIKKNASTINVNKNIISIKKNPNSDTNNKILKSNPYNTGLTQRKYKNFDKLSILYDKKLNKNENKVKINTSRINSSLRNFIFSKCISNSNLA